MKLLFLKFLKHTIGMAIILFITVDPISLVLADDDLSARFNFDPMTETADIQFFDEHLTKDIIEKIKSTPYFINIKSYFKDKEKMSPSVFDVVRNYFFDLDSLSEIKKQEHLIPLDGKTILNILIANVKLTRIYPEYLLIGYSTSIKSKHKQFNWSLEEYNKNLIRNEIFNKPYHNIYRSITKGFEKNWIIEHNNPISDKEIKLIKAILKEHRDIYQKILAF